MTMEIFFKKHYSFILRYIKVRKIPSYIIVLVLSACLGIMGILGIQAYQHAKAYESYTTELVSHQGAKEQAKKQLSKWAKNILGKLYHDEGNETLATVKIAQEQAMNKAKIYTAFFVLVLVLLLCSYFFISLRTFTLFAALSAMLSLFFGLISPILMVTIHKEVEYLGDIVLSFESKGIMGSIIKLYHNGDLVVATVVLLFSVLIPILKILSLFLITLFIEHRFAYRIVHFFKLIGKWSMIDVFVVAVFLVYLTANNGEVSRAEVEVGLYFFLAYVIVSMLVSLSADRMLQQSKG